MFEVEFSMQLTQPLQDNGKCQRGCKCSCCCVLAAADDDKKIH